CSISGYINVSSFVAYNSSSCFRSRSTEVGSPYPGSISVKFCNECIAGTIKCALVAVLGGKVNICTGTSSRYIYIAKFVTGDAVPAFSALPTIISSPHPFSGGIEFYQESIFGRRNGVCTATPCLLM